MLKSKTVLSTLFFCLCIVPRLGFAGGMERLTIEVLNTQESETDSVYFRFVPDESKDTPDLTALTIPGSNRNCPAEVRFGEPFQVEGGLLSKIQFQKRMRIEIWEKDSGPAGENEDEMIGSVVVDVDEEIGTILEGKRWSQDWTYDLSWKSSL